MAKAQSKFTKTPDWLLEKIRTQRNEIEQLTERAIADSATEKISATDRQLISFRINIEGLEGDAIQVPQRFRAGIRDVYKAFSGAELIRAGAESLKANTAFTQRLREKSFNHYICAERALGAAVALSQVEKVTSAIAKAKAMSGHSETHALRAQVIDCWRKKIDPKVSAEQVARKIARKFHWKSGEGVSHRTIAEWVAAEKKKSRFS